MLSINSRMTHYSISLFVTPCVSFSSPDPAILLEMDLAGSGDKNDLLHVERMCYDKQKWISFVACVFPPLLSSFPFLIFFFEGRRPTNVNRLFLSKTALLR